MTTKQTILYTLGFSGKLVGSMTADLTPEQLHHRDARGRCRLVAGPPRPRRATRPEASRCRSAGLARWVRHSVFPRGGRTQGRRLRRRRDAAVTVRRAPTEASGSRRAGRRVDAGQAAGQPESAIYDRRRDAGILPDSRGDARRADQHHPPQPRDAAVVLSDGSIDALACFDAPPVPARRC